MLDLILLVTSTEYAKLTETGLAMHHFVNVSFLCEVYKYSELILNVKLIFLYDTQANQ